MKKTYKGRVKAILILSFFLILTILSIINIQSKIKAFISSSAPSRAQSYAIKVVNFSVNKALSEDELTYDSIVKITSDSNNDIKSIQIDMIKLNKVKSKIEEEVNSKLCKNNIYKIKFPLFSIIGINSYYPSININYNVTGSIKIKIKNSFESAGINQTVHKIIFEADINLYISSLGTKEHCNIKTQECISQTVIVGEIPQYISQQNICQK